MQSPLSCSVPVSVWWAGCNSHVRWENGVYGVDAVAGSGIRLFFLAPRSMVSLAERDYVQSAVFTG